MKTYLQKMYHEDRSLTLLVGGFMVVFYAYLLKGDGPWMGSVYNGLIFTSMLQHLMHGQFFVDPDTIRAEGFVRNGHVYAYWGIWCALLRLPLLLMHHPKTDMTRASCLTAVWLAGMAKLRAVLFVRRMYTRALVTVGRGIQVAFGCTLLYVIFGASETAYLTPSIYQEVVLWSAAFGAIFVFFAVVGLLDGFTRGRLTAMATCAGLALLTRVSTGIGLCVAFVLLLLVLAWQRRKQRVREERGRYLLPSCVLLLLLMCAGTVNYFRWGSPLKFADFSRYIFYQEDPVRMLRMQRYGNFSVRRIPYGVEYYFVPVMEFHTHGPHFYATRDELVDETELPPGSLLITEMLPCALGVLLLAKLRKRRRVAAISGYQVGALGAGLVVPGLLMLMAIGMTYRYRMEFYPPFDLMTFLTLYLAAMDEDKTASLVKGRWWLWTATAISLAAALVEYQLYKHWLVGPTSMFVRDSVVEYYWRIFHP